MAALHLAIATLASAGDHIVASSSLYGGTINLLMQTLPRFGIRTTLGQSARSRRVRRRDRTANAARHRRDHRQSRARGARHSRASPKSRMRAGVPLLIDNTFATPYLCRPIEQGADIVMHSLTKWIGGHGLVIGGVLVDGGRFDWSASGRHPDDDRTLRRLSRPRSSPNISARRRSSCARGPRACATSARAFRRTTRPAC